MGTPSFHEFLQLRRGGIREEVCRQLEHAAPTELCSSVAAVTITMALLRSCQKWLLLFKCETPSQDYSDSYVATPVKAWDDLH